MSYAVCGDLDVVKLSGDQVDQVKDDPCFTAHGAGYLWYLTMNMSGVEALSNVNMRLAISNALDREAIVNDVVKDRFCRYIYRSAATVCHRVPTDYMISSADQTSVPGLLCG